LTRLLAFVDILVDSPSRTEVVTALTKLPNIEELYEVTGKSDIVSLVSGTDIDEIRNLLKNDIRKIPGIRNVLTSIVLNSPRTIRTSQ
jgi:DNA-binding Lrp family transcriptional regulator